MRSVMNHNFSQTPKINIPRSQFDRSHGIKTTFDAGYLVPFFVDEVLPGDTYNVNATLFARLATPLVPMMDNLFLETFYFFVPNRILWTNWERMQGAQDDPGDSISFTIPQMVSTAGTGYLASSLHDYLTLPTEIPGLSHSSLWHRAYNLIYNDWFRDENLQNSVVVDLDDGTDSPTDYVLLRRGKRHDYFTSCLPWPQKGTSISLPLGTSANLIGTGSALIVDAGTYPYFFTTGAGSNLSDAKLRARIAAADATDHVSFNQTTATSIKDVGWGSVTGLKVNATDLDNLFTVDLSTATAATINQLREAEQLQKILERDARGGTRYVEQLRSHWGVISPDFRLQRPEYLGGGSTRISVTPVPQMSSTDATTPQGNLAAYGTAVAHGHGFVKSFVEHGVLLGIVNVRADLNYQEGLDRMWSRSTRYDFYIPALAALGEQSVLNKEIVAKGTGNPTQDAAVFGYQERWAEYRYKRNNITGQFRSNFATSLDQWHLALDFNNTLPVLNAAFIVDDPPIDRCIAVPADPHFIMDGFIQMKCARPMPIYSIPSLTDRF